jgi:hypothetical protein
MGVTYTEGVWQPGIITTPAGSQRRLAGRGGTTDVNWGDLVTLPPGLLWHAGLVLANTSIFHDDMGLTRLVKLLRAYIAALCSTNWELLRILIKHPHCANW